MSALIKVAVTCDIYDRDTYDKCSATGEGTIDLSHIGHEGLDLTSVTYPDEWEALFFPDPSGPGEHRVCCPKHKELFR